MEETVDESQLHWADEKEVIKSNKPLKILLMLFKHLPGWLVRALIYPVSFFYLIFSSRARNEALGFQKQLKEYTKGQSPEKISAYKQILSFSLCVLEKMQGWLGQIKFNKIHYEDDDITKLLDNLKSGKGAILITSHLGNMELMRSLSDYNEQLVGRPVPIVVIMELAATEQFTKTLNEINDKVALNVVNSADIGPDTICYLQEQVENGALLILAGDRTSAHARDKFTVQNFLGKPAEFPYGTFLIPFLIKNPVYYMFGLRERTSIFDPKYKIYIEESKIDVNCGRSERENNIKAMTEEFSQKLEKYAAMYPYQWYNFFNFWKMD